MYASDSVTLWELALYYFFNSVPYAVILYVIFCDNFRYSKMVTKISMACLFLMQFVIMYMQVIFDTSAMALNPISILLYLLYMLLFIKTYFGKICFYLLMLSNFGNFVVTIAKCVEGVVSPQMATMRYRWSYSAALFVIEVFGLLPFTLYLHWYKTATDNSNTAKSTWRTNWMIPLMFYGIWFYLFKWSNPGKPFLETLLDPFSTLICAALLACQLIIYSFVSRFMKYYAKSLELQNEIYQTSLREVQYRAIEHKILQTRTMRHDMRHHLMMLRSYANNGDLEHIQQYLNDLFGEATDLSPVRYTGNNDLNIVLAYYADACRSQKITYEVSIQYPDELPFSPSGISVVFGNLLENAFDACCILPEGKRFIKVKGSFRQKQYVLLISNSYNNKIKKDSLGNFLTTKDNGSGIGTESVKNIVTSVNGTIYFTPGKDVFQVSIVIPEATLPSRKNEVADI